MPARLYAHIGDAEAPLVLERATPRAPWSFAPDQRPDLVATGPGIFSLLHKGRSYRVLVLKEDRATNTYRLRIGARTCNVRLEDEHAHLVQQLGLDRPAQHVLRELKAPMPGLVLQVLVSEGSAVRKNDPVLVLEAMKMENVIKSPGDAVVARVHATERTAVEKDQLLVSFV